MAPPIIPASFPFYPTSGYRDGYSGGLRNVGTHGYIWSSSPASASSDSATFLRYDNVDVSPEGIDARPFGFPVRCVQE